MTDPAVARARGVVGLYGDPTVSWSIALDIAFTTPYDAGRLLERAAAVYAAHPGLGRRPSTLVEGDDSADALRELLDAPYGDDDALVRLATWQDGRRLALAAHHGAVDGLGLLALLGLLLNDHVVSTARGIGDRSSRTGFVRSSLARLAEGVLSPPTRLARARSGCDSAARAAGDVVASTDLPPMSAGTARTIAAAAAAVADWNGRHEVRTNRLVAAVGASRRDGGAAAPDRDTAYLRLRLAGSLDRDSVSRALDSTDPEPTFPEGSPGAVVKLVTRALRSRLGSSFLVSNLGLLRVPPSVERIAFYPTAAGPRALAVGVVSTPTCTTLTVRMPRADFDEAAAKEICALITDRLQQ